MLPTDSSEIKTHIVEPKTSSNGNLAMAMVKEENDSLSKTNTNQSISSLPVLSAQGVRHALTSTESIPRTIPFSKMYGNEWIILLFALSIIIYISVKLTFTKYVNNFREALTNFNVSTKLWQNKNILFTRSSFFLNIIFYLNFSLAITEGIVYFGLVPLSHPINIFLWCLLIVFTTFVLQYFNFIFLGFIFGKQDVFSEYSHQIFLINKNLGIFLFPFIVAIPFAPEIFIKYLIYLAIFVTSIMLIIRFINAIQLIKQKKLSLFYSILYLCTLEILPIMVCITFAMTSN